MRTTTHRQLTGIATAWLIAVTMATSPARAQTPYNCGTGLLRDVTLETDIIPTHTITTATTRHKKSGKRETHIITSAGERREKTYMVTIQLADMVYTGESSGNMPWNFNPLRLVINDPIPACADSRHLILRRPDGKDYKLKIVRAVRGEP